MASHEVPVAPDAAILVGVTVTRGASTSPSIIANTRGLPVAYGVAITQPAL